MSTTIKHLLSLFILVLAAIYLYFYHEAFTILLSIEAKEILSIVLLNFAFFVATSITFALLVAMVGVRLSGLEVLSLTFLTNFFNYLGPLRPGAAVKAVYLKSEKHLNFAQFSAVLAANAFLMLFFTGGSGVVLILLLWSTADIFSIELLLLSSLATCAAIIPFIVPISIDQQDKHNLAQHRQRFAGLCVDQIPEGHDSSGASVDITSVSTGGLVDSICVCCNRAGHILFNGTSRGRFYITSKSLYDYPE